MQQSRIATEQGCATFIVCPDAQVADSVNGFLNRDELSKLNGFEAVALWSTVDDLGAVRRALASRDGTLIPLISETDFAERCIVERHVCIDTTAAGGNASLLAESSG